jgi:hypothetical protein
MMFYNQPPFGGAGQVAIQHTPQEWIDNVMACMLTGM